MARTGEGDNADLILPAAPGEPATDDEVLALGSQRTPPRWLVIAAVVVLFAGVVAMAAVKRGGHHTAVPAPSASLASPPAENPLPQGMGQPLELGETVPIDLAAATGVVLVLTASPPRLGQVDSASGRLNRQVAVPAGSRRLVMDRAGEHAWIIAGRDALAYDASTLAPIGKVTVPATVFAAAVLNDRLFMATDQGVYMTALAREPYLGLPQELTRLPGFKDSVQTISADPSRHRLLAISQEYALLTVDSRAVHVVRQLHTHAPESIEVTDAAIWAVGFGDVGGTRVARLDPLTLQLTSIDAGDANAPQGARGWPGAAVFWVKNAYTDSIACRDARSGVVGAIFPGLDGPVVSTPGAAYAISRGDVVRVATSMACPG
jgi:hypothetical protein